MIQCIDNFGENVYHGSNNALIESSFRALRLKNMPAEHNICGSEVRYAQRVADCARFGFIAAITRL